MYLLILWPEEPRQANVWTFGLNGLYFSICFHFIRESQSDDIGSVILPSQSDLTEACRVSWTALSEVRDYQVMVVEGIWMSSKCFPHCDTVMRRNV